MPPAWLEVALDKLGVVDEGVRAGRERDHRIRPSRKRVLCVGGVDERAVVRLDAKRERRRRVKDARGTDAEPPDLLVAPVLELANRKLGGQVIDVDGKERVVHSQAEELAHGAGLLRSADAERSLRIVRGTEKRNALNMVPVEVREQEIDGERPRTAAVH